MAKAAYRVTLYGEVDPGVWSFGVRSFTREGITHETSINLHTGECFCTCEYATMGGLNKLVPTILDEDLMCRPCKHARRILQEAGWICAERERTAKRINKELRRMAA